MISWCTILGVCVVRKPFTDCYRARKSFKISYGILIYCGRFSSPGFPSGMMRIGLARIPETDQKKFINLYPVLFHAHPQTPNSGCEVIVKSILYKSHVSKAAQPRLLNVRGGGEFVQRHFGSRHQTSHLAKLTTHLKAGPRDQLEENMEK